jgi:tartrate dehydrogenase/decarboxylase/D-malate dehydrogenase
VIGGDGIGPEVVTAGLRVLRAVAAADGFALDTEDFPWGSDFYRKYGVMMPDDGVAAIRGFDAIYFGAVGDTEIPDDVTLWGLRLALCQGLDQYANVRPAKLLPGLTGPLREDLGRQVDWIVVRENSEGEYAGVGGRPHIGTPLEVGIDTTVFTRTGVERIQRYAFEIARTRPRKHLTCVTKSNAQKHGMVMWDDIFKVVAKDYPDVETNSVLVDACAAQMVLKPGSMDVVVATNLHADILSDLAGALSGSLGMAASANLDPERRGPSMFEPVHGTAPDIVGQGIANPLAAITSGAMMFDHLGEAASAARLNAAVERMARDGDVLPPDLGGTASTEEVADAVIEALEQGN